MNRKQQLIQRQQELLNTAKAAARELNAEEQAEFDNIQRELDAIVAGEVQTPGEEGKRSVPRVDPGKEKAAMEVVRDVQRSRICAGSSMSVRTMNRNIFVEEYPLRM